MFVFVMVVSVGKTMIGAVVIVLQQQEKWLVTYEMKQSRL